MTDIIAMINENQGVVTLVLAGIVFEVRIHLRHVIRRLERLEDND